MVIDNFDIPRGSIPPHEAKSELIVDPDAPLSFSITGKLFEPIVRRYPQAFDARGSMQHLKLSYCHGREVRKARHAGAV
jgi:hypothetical protein